MRFLLVHKKTLHKVGLKIRENIVGDLILFIFRFMETLRPELKQPRNEHLKDTMLEGSLFHQLLSQLGAFYLDWEVFKTQQFVAGQ